MILPRAILVSFVVAILLLFIDHNFCDMVSFLSLHLEYVPGYWFLVPGFLGDNDPFMYMNFSMQTCTA